MHDAVDASTVIDRHHLLGHPTDLAGHIGALGPLPFQTAPHAGGWGASLMAALEASGLSGAAEAPPSRRRRSS